MTALLVGLDVGTTASKAVVFGVNGRPVAQGKAPTPWTCTNRQGAEIRADDLLAAACAALAQSLDDAPQGPVLALGVTSMGESGVLLGSAGEALAPIVAWHDHRDDVEIAGLLVEMGADVFARRTGLPLPGQWSLTKHRWLLAHHPEAAAAVRRLNVAEWVVRRLGGAEAAEQSLASRTGWLDLSGRQWWPEALAWSGARPSLMPDLVTAGTALGTDIDRFQGKLMHSARWDHGYDLSGKRVASIGTGASAIPVRTAARPASPGSCSCSASAKFSASTGRRSSGVPQ